LDEDFVDEMMEFMVKTVIVSGCIFALLPAAAGTFTGLGVLPQMAAPGRLYLDPQSGTYWVYLPEEEVN
jgi:hypothetical protein